RDAAPPILERDAHQIADDVAEVVACILERLPLTLHSQAADNARRLLAEVNRLARELWAAEGLERSDELKDELVSAHAPDLLYEANFYVATLVYQARYLRHASPLTLTAIRSVLVSLLNQLPCQSVHGGRVSIEVSSYEEMLPWSGGLYSERDLRAHLTAL